MGTSTNGILAYGYDLGAEESLLVAEAQESETNEYGYLKLSWYDSENEEITEQDGEELELVALLAKRLYDSIPDAPPAEYDWQWQEIVKERLGVWFEDYCSGDYSMWILTTAVTTVHRGDTKVIDSAELAIASGREGWDEKLAHALSVLDMHPIQQQPAWLLASYWG